jgi:hypothetical protein
MPVDPMRTGEGFRTLLQPGKLAFFQLNYSRSIGTSKYSKINRLRVIQKSPSVRIPDSTVSRTWHSIKNDLRHADELAQNENGQYATSAAAHLKLLIGERHVSLMFTPPFSISK